MDSARTWRGGQNQVMLSAQGMAALGHDVLVACRHGGVLAERLQGSGLAAASIPFAGDLSVPAALSLRRAIQRFRPDVVHTHDPHALAASLPTPLPRRVASRRVDFALRGGPSRWKYLRCARVVAVSQAVLAVLEAGRLPKDRLRLVYEGVPDRAPEPGGRRALAELGVPETSPLVGNVAALTGHKDHETLLRAAAEVVAHVPTVRFVIVGDGERRADLVALTARLGLSGHVVFTGFRTDLDRLIPAFDVFCLSSHMEGLGTSVLDAMCFGVPVVATAAGGLPEVVEDGVTGRVVPVRDPAALAQALREIVGDPSRRARLGAASRTAFRARFTAARMVESTLAVYEELA